MICDIFNFEKVTITADNMISLISENISEKINRFCQKYEKFQPISLISENNVSIEYEKLYERINKHQIKKS